MNPIDNAETAYLMALRAQAQVQPKNMTQVIDRMTVTNQVVQAGTRQAQEVFGTFIVSCPLTVCTVARSMLIRVRRKIQRRRPSRPRPMPRLLVFLRTSFLTGSSSALDSTTIGA